MQNPQTPNPVIVPQELWEALQARPELLAVWNRLSAAHQREYAGWISGTKIAATRVRRIEKALIMIEQWRRDHPERVAEPA